MVLEWAFYIFHIEECKARGFLLFEICNHTARCYYILHTGPLH